MTFHLQITHNFNMILHNKSTVRTLTLWMITMIYFHLEASNVDDIVNKKRTEGGLSKRGMGWGELTRRGRWYYHIRCKR